MKNWNHTIIFLISGLVATSVITACGGSGFKVKDVTKDLLGGRMKVKPAPTTGTTGTAAPEGTQAVAPVSSSEVTPVTPGTPATPAKTVPVATAPTAAATAKTESGCPNEIYSECTTKTAITEKEKTTQPAAKAAAPAPQLSEAPRVPQPGDEDFMGPVLPALKQSAVVEVKKEDGKDNKDEKSETVTPTLALKTGYDILFRDELHQIIIKNRKAEVKAAGTEILFDLELDGKMIVPLKVVHTAQVGVQNNLATTKSVVHQTKNGDKVTVYVNSFCKLKTDSKCDSNILILDFMIENGKVDQNMVAGMGVVISPKLTEPQYYSDSFIVTPGDDAEQMGMDQFVELLETKLN
jgi:hypothetical protein